MDNITNIPAARVPVLDPATDLMSREWYRFFFNQFTITQNTGGGDGVTTFTCGATGLTPSTATAGAVSLAGVVNVAHGGTSLATLTANNVMLGNGTSAPTFVAPSTAGNVLTSNGTTWTSAAGGAGSGTVTSVSVVTDNGVSGTVATATTTPAITLTLAKTGTSTTYVTDTSPTLITPALGTPTALVGTNITGTAAAFNINGTVGATTPTTGSFTTVAHSAGTTAIAPIKLTSGTNLTAAVAGAAEYDGTNLYFTQDTTQGRGVVPTCQQFYLSSAGTAFGTAAALYFGAGSAISLNASSTYYIETFCFFLKTTAGTAQWDQVFSNAVTLAHSTLTYTPVTGFTTTLIIGAMVNAEATKGTATTLSLAATASLTTARNHIHKFQTTIVTNAACNYRLNLAQSAGTVTPQAGSYYKVTRVGGTAGNFVA
jgi:hypothetical protein